MDANDVTFSPGPSRRAFPVGHHDVTSNPGPNRRKHSRRDKICLGSREFANEPWDASMNHVRFWDDCSFGPTPLEGP